MRTMPATVCPRTRLTTPEITSTTAISQRMVARAQRFRPLQGSGPLLEGLGGSVSRHSRSTSSSPGSSMVLPSGYAYGGGIGTKDNTTGEFMHGGDPSYWVGQVGPQVRVGSEVRRFLYVEPFGTRSRSDVLNQCIRALGAAGLHAAVARLEHREQAEGQESKRHRRE